MSSIQYILTDIEGTTTSISFVVDTLFPYFMQEVEAFVAENPGNEALLAQLALVKETVFQEEGKNLSSSEAVQQLITWTQADRKHPALKALQGMVWKSAYLEGKIQGHIYPEVPAVLNHWREKGLKLGVYSSGSVPAQQLLFGYSEFGDLCPYFSDHFDTAIGHKKEIGSYENIQKELGIPAKEILFLSDVEAELDAAASAGFQTLQLVREGTKPSDKHQKANNFNEISI